MRGLSSFLGRFRRGGRQDDVFGAMISMGTYWEGHAKVPFEPFEIEVSVDGSKDDDLTLQHYFFAQFVEEWPKLKESVYGYLSKEDWRRLPQATDDDFRLSLVSVPKGRLEDAEWRLFLDCTTEGEYSTVTVDMRGREPKAFSIDG